MLCVAESVYAFSSRHCYPALCPTCTFPLETLNSYLSKESFNFSKKIYKNSTLLVVSYNVQYIDKFSGLLKLVQSKF